MAADQTMPVHPISQFEEYHIGTSQLKVEEIGSYSLVGAAEKMAIVNNDGQLRKLNKKDLPRGFNLDEGFVVKDECYNHIKEYEHLYKWLLSDSAKPATSIPVDIITSKRLLSELIKIPYNQDKHGAFQWRFGATRTGGKVFIGNIARREMEGIYSQPEKPHEQSNYWGLRFEICSTTNEGADGEPVVGFSRFRSVVHVTIANPSKNIKPIRILSENGIDAEDSTLRRGTSKFYVDLTIVQDTALPHTRPLLFFGSRLLRWWTNNIFTKVGKVIAGVHQDGKLLGKRTYEMNRIPLVVDAVKREWGNPAVNFALWTPEICLGFMYKLLTFVIENTEDDGCVYEFYCPCPAKGVHQITNECVFRYEKIPLRLAEGHDYIPHDQDFIGMLEKWK